MEKTTNYQLPKWSKDDFIKMDDFNAAFQTIDETLKAAADATAEKADAATVQQAVAALQTALGSGGKTCRISSGSYMGNGRNGKTTPSSLTFDFTPVLVAFVCEGSSSSHSLFLRSESYGVMGGTTGTIIWGEKSVSWYCENPNVSGDVQLNQSGKTYHYVALGY